MPARADWIVFLILLQPLQFRRTFWGTTITNSIAGPMLGSVNNGVDYHMSTKENYLSCWYNCFITGTIRVEPFFLGGGGYFLVVCMVQDWMEFFISLYRIFESAENCHVCNLPFKLLGRIKGLGMCRTIPPSPFY